MTAIMVMTAVMVMTAMRLTTIVLMTTLVMTMLTMILMVIFRAKGKYEIFTDMDKNIRQGTYATPTMPLFSGTFAQ